jgi:hypothetical protein
VATIFVRRRLSITRDRSNESTFMGERSLLHPGRDGHRPSGHETPARP